MDAATESSTAHLTQNLVVEEFLDPYSEKHIVSEIVSDMRGVPKIERVGFRGRTKILRYGYDYPNARTWIGDPPAWVGMVNVPTPFDSVTVNEYTRGDIIGPHVDSLNFEGPVAILSLLSEAEMKFKRLKSDETFSVVLPRRSLVVLHGTLRYEWTHAIEPVKHARISVVFRKKSIR